MRGKKHPRLEGATECTAIDDQYCSDTFFLYEIGWRVSWTPVVGCPIYQHSGEPYTGCGDAHVSNESLNAALYNLNHSIYGTALHKQNLFSRNQMDKLQDLFFCKSHNLQSTLNTNDNFNVKVL